MGAPEPSLNAKLPVTSRFGGILALALMAVPSSVPAAAEDGTSLCVAPIYPRERYVAIKMGYSKDLPPFDHHSGWFEPVKDRLWQLSIPDDYVIWDQRASDRAEVSIHVTLDLLYPEMLPVVEVEEEMEQLGIARFGPFRNKAGLPGCERRGPLGIADLGRKVTIDLWAPSPVGRVPLDERQCVPFSEDETVEVVEPHISGLRACRRRSNATGDDTYGTLDDQPFVLTCPRLGGFCVAAFDLWTWHVNVHFGKDRFNEWQSIVGATRAFLDSATQSKSDITGDIK
jgi:hypothetical protein